MTVAPTFTSPAQAAPPGSSSPGIAHASFQQKNHRLVYHVLHAFFSQPALVYRGR